MSGGRALSPPVGLPTARERQFDPPDELGRLRNEQPISRMTYPDGHLGWLVTGWAEARAVLADNRFSNRLDLLRSPVPTNRTEQKPAQLPPGMFIRMDPPEHTRYRKLLVGQFSPARMNALTTRIEEIAGAHLDAMAAAEPPLDLVRHYALPIPSLVICELLGVPYADRERFEHNATLLLNLDATPQESAAAMGAVHGFLMELVRAKRSEPTDDVLGGLVAEGSLDDVELATIGMLLLIAGHETTANMIALGVFALLQHPEQLEKLRGEPSLADQAVEELLRYLTVSHIGPIRCALADVEVAGVQIKAGESVTISLPAANRDPRRFGHGEAFDITQSAAGQLTFGHGVHLCLGHQLARIELGIAITKLLERFPALRLAVSPDSITMRTESGIYGVHELPVTW